MIELPTLYAKNIKGDIEQWRVTTDGACVITEHGKVGGKQVTHRVLASPTNVGRSNERDAVAQAEFEAQAAWTKKKDQGYFDSVADAKAVQVLLPMLAQKFKPKNARFPLSAQRKLNGLRCMAIVRADGSVELRSRGGKEWDIEHVAQSVRVIGKPGDIFDGEIYLHGVSLQQLNSLVKNTARPERSALQYHLYDMPRTSGQPELPWEERWLQLQQRFQPGLALELVETRVLHSEDSVKAFERESVLGGYEGLILRLHGEGYQFAGRPKSLMKWKSFSDGEFVVVDMRSRVHAVNEVRETICDVCVVRNDITDDTFEVVPRGTVEQKAEYWKNRDYYMGRYLVVRYLERSDKGIPQGNPVGVAFRLEEDAPPPDDADIWS